MKIKIIEDDNIFIIKTKNVTSLKWNNFSITYKNTFYNKEDLINLLLKNIELTKEEIKEIIYELKYEHIRISRKDKYNRYNSILEDILQVIKALENHINYNPAGYIIKIIDN